MTIPVFPIQLDKKSSSPKHKVEYKQTFTLGWLRPSSMDKFLVAMLRAALDIL